MKICICDDNAADREKIGKLYVGQRLGEGAPFEVKTMTINEVLQDIDEKRFDFDVICTEILFYKSDINGIDLVKRINKEYSDCLVIYVSNATEYAQDVYETEHTYFVRKATLEDGLVKAMRKIFNIRNSGIKRNILKLKSEGHQVYLDARNVIYIEKENRKTKLITADRVYPCYMSLTELLDQLDSRMVRVHGGFIVNMTYLTYIGNDYVELTGGIRIPIGRTFEESLKKQYCDFWSGKL